MVIIITHKAICKYDAIGNDVIAQYNLFKKLGHEVYLYAEYYDPEFKKYGLECKHFKKSIKLQNNLLIYHHSGYWKEGDRIFETLKCRVFYKYHNITPAKYFRKYSRYLAHVTKKGREQTEKNILSGKITLYLPDSEYNASELYELGAAENKIAVIEPFTKIKDFEACKINNNIKNELSDDYVNILFVGRIAPNKGHKHIINIISKYISAYDRKIRMIFIGGLDIYLRKYYYSLINLVNSLNLSGNIFFKFRVNFDDLYTYYKYSDIFLLMSEHEGFCVPILEAQFHDLPIISIGRTAVDDIIGPEQVVMDELNYLKIASAVSVVKNNKNYRKYLAMHGEKNLKRFEESSTDKKYINLIKVLK